MYATAGATEYSKKNLLIEIYQAEADELPHWVEFKAIRFVVGKSLNFATVTKIQTTSCG